MEAYFSCFDEETALQRCSFLCEPLHQAAEVTVARVSLGWCQGWCSVITGTESWQIGFQSY